MIFFKQITELTSILKTHAGIIIGSAVTLSDMEVFLKKVISEEPKWRTRVFREASGIWWFIKNANFYDST